MARQMKNFFLQDFVEKKAFVQQVAPGNGFVF